VRIDDRRGSHVSPRFPAAPHRARATPLVHCLPFLLFQLRSRRAFLASFVRPRHRWEFRLGRRVETGRPEDEPGGWPRSRRVMRPTSPNDNGAHQDSAGNNPILQRAH
jgi:hypothetical protein